MTTPEAQASLARVVGHLDAAAGAAEAMTIADNLEHPELGTREFSIKTALWLAQALAGVSLRLATPPANATEDDVVAALHEAEAELRSRAIWEYPVGTSELVRNVCDNLAALRPAHAA